MKVPPDRSMRPSTLPRRPPVAFLALIVAALLPHLARSADWPAWRHDARRTAASPQPLAAQLRWQWVRERGPLKPAWPDQPNLQFDAAYEPVVAGKMLYVGSSREDSVVAFDTAGGAEKWRFFTDGPVRFAPLVWEGRLYV